MQPLAFSWFGSSITSAFYDSLWTITNPAVVWPVFWRESTGNVFWAIIGGMLILGWAIALIEWLVLWWAAKNVYGVVWDNSDRTKEVTKQVWTAIPTVTTISTKNKKRLWGFINY